MNRHPNVWGVVSFAVTIAWLLPFFAPVLNANPVTFAPAPIPVTEPELVNPLRGYYEWRGVETVPQPETAPDAYNRYFWHDADNPARSLETAPGVYNFSALDADIAAAAARGKKFAFRIRAMATDASGKRYIPDHLAGCGWDYNGTFIPDWNGACFLDNAAALMNALGARYNNDPRIAWMDIGMYGRWGEWAMLETIYTSAPPGFTVATDDTLRRIVQMQLDAFPDIQKVMMAKTRSVAVIHALSSSERVGWRVDCLGQNGYFDFATNPRYSAAWPYMQNRWHTAPVIVEFCTSNFDATYATALSQVSEYHITLIGNGNMSTWDRKTPEQQANLLMIGKTAGYRYQIREVSTAQTWSPGEQTTMVTQWENVGVAPYYEDAHVTFKLYDPTAARYVWEERSQANLRGLLPTGGEPLAVSDAFSIPGGIAPGAYELRVVVTDPRAYRKPLRLAIAGAQPDGSYVLGSISVGEAAVTPSPTPETPTALPSETSPATDTPLPSETPTEQPSSTPTALPSNTPTTLPSNTPTALPSNTPTALPSNTPTTLPSNTPTALPSNTPTTPPSNTPTALPSATPTLQTGTYAPLADTYVSSASRSTNYGTRTTLRANSSPAEIAYLRFDLTGLAGKTVTQARLRFRLSNGASNRTTQTVRSVLTETWTENGMTYTNRPGVSSAVYGSLRGGSTGAWVEIDITSLLQSKTGTVFSLAIVTASRDAFVIYSRESSSDPQLLITYR